MKPSELTATFDEMAERYDQQWARLSSISSALHLLMGAVFNNLPDEAKLLCVGAGTGCEILSLGHQFPNWTFTIVEPSAKMLEVCQARLQQAGLDNRCRYHQGYLETLSTGQLHHGATSLLVSQFFTNRMERIAFFQAIASFLKPMGKFINADLAGETGTPEYLSLLQTWMTLIANANLTDEARLKMRRAYEMDLAIVKPNIVSQLMVAGGFVDPVQFFQAGMIHAWYCQKR